MIWNDEKKEVEDENFFDLPSNIENNLQLASKLMDILKKYLAPQVIKPKC